MQINYGLDLFQALSELARHYQFRNRDEVCCYGITPSQCYALQTLSRKDSLPSSELSGQLGLDLSSTTRLVDELVRKKLVVRQRARKDARIREIQITDVGRRMVNRVEADFSKVVSDAVASFPEIVRTAIPKVLRQLTSVLDCCEIPAVIPGESIRKITR
jgi:MarR family transcriptional regulator, 2-MHQ and catechol-resistance regulon repressor